MTGDKVLNCSINQACSRLYLTFVHSVTNMGDTCNSRVIKQTAVLCSANMKCNTSSVRSMEDGATAEILLLQDSCDYLICCRVYTKNGEVREMGGSAKNVEFHSIHGHETSHP
jgi:hypothetical protein